MRGPERLGRFSFFARTWFSCAIYLASCGDSPTSSPEEHRDAGVDAGMVESAASADGLTLTLADGKIEGQMAGEARAFLKIPYAKPPLGDLRWRAPVKNETWSGTRKETAYAGACVQEMNNQGPTSLNEDCLYLNVWAPKGASGATPVMVWIHGGGNFAGSAADRVPVPGVTDDQKPLWYDGQFLSAKRDVVVVTLNYRLGPLGFFAHSALRAEGSPPGNQGILDQRMALTWVHDNIAKFGGDPKNVTIFGESAGSGDVCLHVLSPGSRGLFHRAISQSGGCTAAVNEGRQSSSEQAAAAMRAYASALGCADSSDALTCMRAKTPAELLSQAQQPMPTDGTMAPRTWTFDVVVDGPGGVLPENGRALFRKGDVAKVPYILGSNSDEGSIFTLRLPPITSDAQYLAALQQRFPSGASQIAAAYPATKFGGDYMAALTRVVGDSGLVCGTHDTARLAQQAGLTVFMYNFNVAWSISPQFVRAAHAAEISHVFGAPYLATPDDQRLSDAMTAYWANFARTGNPNGADAPVQWPAFAPTAQDSDQRLQLDLTIEVLTDFRKEECAFWRARYEAS